MWSECLTKPLKSLPSGVGRSQARAVRHPTRENRARSCSPTSPSLRSKEIAEAFNVH